jgi:hypothetical protein
VTESGGKFIEITGQKCVGHIDSVGGGKAIPVKSIVVSRIAAAFAKEIIESRLRLDHFG